MTKHVVVIGAGIVGACTALRLARDGHRVTLVEPGQPGGTQAASYGNGAWISPASILPVSMPGLWRQVPLYLLDRDGPLTVRWGDFPALLPWLIRFMWSGLTEARVTRTARALTQLVHDAPARHQALAASIDRSELIVQKGLLYAFPDRSGGEIDSLSWRLRREAGVRVRELDAAGVAAIVPDIAPRYNYGILVEDGAHCLDPGGYTGAVAAAAIALGATRIQAEATDFAFDGDHLKAVVTGAGPIACDAAVIAAGVHSAPIAAKAGDRVPLASERGYFVTIRNPAGAPAIPVMPQDGKMANTVVHDGFRVAGQVEIARVSAPPNWRRAEILLHHAKNTYPKLAGQTDMVLDRWLGHRPSTPDGKPAIGRSTRSADIVHAFGHGHIGLASGPATAEIVAGLLAGTPSSLDLAPFAPNRFA
jgi:D-amino-acid dehydrogenase